MAKTQDGGVIGAEIARLRLKRHLTQRELAELLGVTQRAISNWEIGLNEPTTRNTRRLATVLGVPIARLVDPPRRRRRPRLPSKA